MNDKSYGFLSIIDITYYLLGFAIITFIANLYAFIYRLVKEESVFKSEETKNKVKKVFVSFTVAFIFLIVKADLKTAVGISALSYLWSSVLSVIKLAVLGGIDKAKEKKGLYGGRIYKGGERFHFEFQTPAEKIVETLKTTPISKAEKDEDNCINVSHVKNILKRLNCITLNAYEKNQIDQLKIKISEIECGRNDEEVKDGINSGLNALLKIMAKYSL